MKLSANRLVLLLAPALLGTAPLGQERIRTEIETALARLEDWSDVAECREELARLGPAALGELFGFLVAAGDATSVVDRAAIESVLASFPRPGVLNLLQRESDGPEERRLVALRLLARMGSRDDLGLALELAVGADRALAVPPALRTALEQTLLAFAERDPATARSLAGRFEHAHPSLHAPLASVIVRSDEALALLSSLLGKSRASDGLLLLEIGRAALPGGDPVVLERVRGYLGHPDPRFAVLAIVALEKLTDHDAVPDLIALLDHQEPNVRTAAHRALSTLTDVHIEASSRAWLEWLDEELAWWDDQASACRRALATGPAPEAAAAILGLAHRHLYRDRAAELLMLALERPEIDLVISACRALAALKAISAVPALTALAGLPDSPARSAALRALRTIERHPHPALASAWHSRLRIED